MSRDSEKIFDSMDKDGSGVVTLEELKTAFAQEGFTSDQIQAMFKAVDFNSDGNITKEEFKIAMNEASPEELKKALKESLFNEFDTNRNGFIDVEDLRAAIKKKGDKGHCRYSDAEFQRWLDKADKNADGKVNYNEFLDAMFNA